MIGSQNLVQNFYEGTTSETIAFVYPVKEIVFISDSDLDITLKVIGTGWDITFTIRPDDIMDEKFRDVSSVEITSTGNWRMYVRSMRKQ